MTQELPPKSTSEGDMREIVRVPMQNGPTDRHAPLSLVLIGNEERTELRILGPMDKRNVVGEVEYERQLVVERKLARVAFYERLRIHNANHRNRRYGGDE
jgi:hypothetical protein